MAKIERITKQTENPYVNLYLVEGKNRVDRPLHYLVASRAKDVGELKMKTRKNTPDGVIIYSLYGEAHDRIILVRQYRVTIDDYIYELPAGLVEPGEDYHAAAVRELHEETGLTFRPLTVDPAYERPFFTTIGMTDESCSAVYGYAEGEISGTYLEPGEEIEVVIADRREAARILREENVAIMCAYHLMYFLKNEDPFGFLR